MGRKALAKSASERSSVEYGKHFVIIQPWGLRDGDGVTDAAEGVVAAGGDDEVVFAARDRIAKDDFGGDEVAFKVLRQGVNANWRQYSI